MENLISLVHPKSVERNLFFAEQVEQKTISEITKKIIEINELDDFNEKIYSCYNLKHERQPIKIYIDSYGGYIYQCFGLLSIIESSKTPIHTIVTGCAMSCGFMILICGHKRFGYSLSTPLYHQASSFLYGKVSDMELELNEVKRLQKKIEHITLKKTKITKEKLKEIYKQKIDWYMDANQALKFGVIDEIL